MVSIEEFDVESEKVPGKHFCELCCSPFLKHIVLTMCADVDQAPRKGESEPSVA